MKKSLGDFFGSLFGKRHEGQRPAISIPERGRHPRKADGPQTQPSPRPRRAGSKGDLYQSGDGIGGKYEVHRKLGEGGFGVVYAVYSRELRSTYALKTFRDEFLADAPAREAFKKEALLWVALEEHPFILAARLVDDFCGRLFIAMDCVAPDERGRVSLQDHLVCARGPLEPEQVLRWTIQSCHGMEHANAHGIKCHRDIKPANILILQGQTLQISDFGLALAGQELSAASRSLVTRGPEGRWGCSLLMTQGRKVCGTPGYLAPEIQEQKGADVRSDIYGFGCVLWQMATGSLHPPFHPSEVQYRGDPEIYVRDYLARVYASQKSGRRSKTDGPLEEVIERCLSFEPTGRCGGFKEVRLELEPLYNRLMGRSVVVPTAKEKTTVFWNNKGFSLNSLGRYEEAIRCYDRALAIDPRYANAWINKGAALWKLGCYDEAIGCYDRALDIEPQTAALWNNRGTSLQCLGRREEAIRCFERALNIDPRYASAWYNKGNNLHDLGRYEEAILCYDRTLDIDPREATAWCNKGNSLTCLGRHEQAIHCYDRALDIDAQLAIAWNNKGNSLNRLGRHEQAIYCYDRALDIDPQLAIAWSNKGNSLHNLGRHEEAIVCCNRAVEIKPRCVDAWYNKAVCEDHLSHRREAGRSYQQFLELAPPAYSAEITHARQRIRELQ